MQQFFDLRYLSEVRFGDEKKSSEFLRVGEGSKNPNQEKNSSEFFEVAKYSAPLVQYEPCRFVGFLRNPGIMLYRKKRRD